MKRRAFIKSMGLGGAAVYIPSTLTITSLLNEAYAASPDYEGVNYSPPNTDPLNASSNAFPQVINVFLYGGPSELAGNLTNIQELDTTSENSYEDSVNGITEFQNNGGLITPHGFWSGAGGDAMEFLINQGHMSVYRTMMKRAEDTQSHRQSIFMNQKGSLDIDDSPGIGTRIAKMLEIHASSLNFPHPVLGADRTLEDLILPFVSFEGETVLYAPDTEEPLSSLRLKPVTLNENFENPYTRDNNNNNTDLNNLVNAVQTAAVRARYQKVYNSFKLRSLMEKYIGDLRDSFDAPLPLVTDAADLVDTDDVDADDGNRLVYPNNTFARQIRAAVTLAIENPDTKFITVSNGGLGGFDDHNNGIDNYPQRMEQLFTALRVAMKHIKYSGSQNGYTTPGGATTGLSRRTDNIIINVFGDFGRRVNLNNSMGWDHGNCQVFYTLGGSAVRRGGTNTLGKVVGATRRIGQANTNDQYLVPTSNSYEFEPMSMAASIYRYFGAQNPQIMTVDPVFYPSGCPAINEGTAGEDTLFTI